MSTRQEDVLQTLDQLLTQQNVKKACTLGVIIDSTNAYFDHKENRHVKKIKVIDESMNTTNTTMNFRYGYCTVMFFADKLENLPNPFSIGDIIYMRRFAFEVYDHSFQARNNSPVYCSWALMHGDSQNTDFAEYQLSRSDLNLKDTKYDLMKDKVQNLRHYAKFFLQKNSILMPVPAGINPKDQDMIVQVVRKNDQGLLRVSDGKREMIVRNCPSFVQETQIGKLRSIAKIILNNDGQNETVNNNFTSLLKLPEWTADAQSLLQQSSAIEIEEVQGIYTELSYLNSAPLTEIEGKVFYIKCEIFHSSAQNFTEAVKYYDPTKNSLSQSAKQSTIPVYKMVFSCQDNSMRIEKSGGLCEIWLFSYDGKGSDFLPRVSLDMLDGFSTLKQENLMFAKRIDAILESQYVEMAVEVLNDGKGNRTLRALNVKC